MDSHATHAVMIGGGVALVGNQMNIKSWKTLGLGSAVLSYLYMKKFGHGMPHGSTPPQTNAPPSQNTAEYNDPSQSGMNDMMMGMGW